LKKQVNWKTLNFRNSSKDWIFFIKKSSPLIEIIDKLKFGEKLIN
jgi:hypothetical protein